MPYDVGLLRANRDIDPSTIILSNTSKLNDQVIFPISVRTLVSVRYINMMLSSFHSDGI